MLSKKAQSQVITTVLIILLVLAAIVIVWQVVNRTVSQASQEVETQVSCVGLNMEITRIVNLDTDAASLEDSVTVRRGTGAPEVEGVKALLFVNGNKVMNGTTNLGQLGTEVLNVGNTQVGPGINLKEGDTVQVAALLDDGTACALSPELVVPAPVSALG